MGWDRKGCDGTGWDGMGRNMRWDGKGREGMRRDGVECTLR